MIAAGATPFAGSYASTAAARQRLFPASRAMATAPAVVAALLSFGPVARV